MREADLLVSRLPVELREPIRRVTRRLGASQDEVTVVVEGLVRDAIRQHFGGGEVEAAELVIAEAVLVRRRRREESALAEIREARKPKLREVG